MTETIVQHAVFPLFNNSLKFSKILEEAIA